MVVLLQRRFLSGALIPAILVKLAHRVVAAAADADASAFEQRGREPSAAQKIIFRLLDAKARS